MPWSTPTCAPGFFLQPGTATSDATCAACAVGTYSYSNGTCAPCAAGATFVSAASGCAPSAPAFGRNTVFYLSGSASEGVSAFPSAVAPSGISFASGPSGASNGALSLASGSYLAAPGTSAPPALPSNGSLPWSASAWVRCAAAPATYSVALGWGAPGGGSGAASLTVGASAAAPLANAFTVSTRAGSGSQAFFEGPATSAAFNTPFGVAVSPFSGTIIVGDRANRRIRLISPGGVVSTLAGSGASGADNGASTSATFSAPGGVALLPAAGLGLVVVADTGAHRIRYVTALGFVSTLAGSGNQGFADGPGATAMFNNPEGVAVITATGVIVVGDSLNCRIRLVSPSGDVSTLAGSGNFAFADGAATTASFQYPTGVAVDQLTGNVIVADQSGGSIRRVTPGGVVSTLAGNGNRGFSDGWGPAASFFDPYGVVVLPNGNIAVVDNGNTRIRLVTPAGLVTSVAGRGQGAYYDGVGSNAAFNWPKGAAVIPASGNIVVADAGNHRVRVVTVIPLALPACDSA